MGRGLRLDMVVVYCSSGRAACGVLVDRLGRLHRGYLGPGYCAQLKRVQLGDVSDQRVFILYKRIDELQAFSFYILFIFSCRNNLVT